MCARERDTPIEDSDGDRLILPKSSYLAGNSSYYFHSFMTLRMSALERSKPKPLAFEASFSTPNTDLREHACAREKLANQKPKIKIVVEKI